MAYNMIMKLVLVQLIVTWLHITVAATSREVQKTNDIQPRHHHESNVTLVRLQESEGGNGMMECWNALLELKWCTNEIILFLFNGESYLGLDCCKAIRVISLHCWPSMLNSLGFTSEEGDILRDYCGTSSSPEPEPGVMDLKRMIPG